MIKIDCAVIPAYNEKETIVSVVRAITRSVRLCIVIDDGSTDGTGYLAKQAGAQVMRLPKNLGTGKATQAGLRRASFLDVSSIVLMDADGQHDPRVIPKLSRALSGDVDMVIGSRYLERSPFSTSVFRRFGTWLISLLFFAFWGIRIHDPTSGFRVFNRRVLRLFVRQYPSLFPEPESLLLLQKHGYVVREIPIRMRKRRYGRSSISFFKALFLMVHILATFTKTGVSRRWKG